MGSHRTTAFRLRWSTPTYYKRLVRLPAPSIPCSGDRDLRVTTFGCNSVGPRLADRRRLHFRGNSDSRRK
jgi:hypothetical protein